jgi:two-component system chemotaxis sensor kinase CheA
LEDAELLNEFVIESRELLDDVEVQLIALERTRTHSGKPDRGTLDAIFRAFHSIKGSAGFLDFPHLVRVTHIAESLLDDLRAERFTLTGDHVTVMCDALDFSRDGLDIVSSAQSDAALASRADSVVEKLRDAIAASSSSPEAASAPQPVAPVAAPSPATVELPAPPPSEAPAAPAIPAAPEGAAPPDDGPSPAATAGGGGRRETIRVDVEKLDSFMNLVGELILAENMVTHNEEAASLKLEGFQQASMHLNRVTRDLHDVAVAVRMVPIGGIFHKMERLVRDLAQKLDKDIDLVTSGAATEVDKNLIESIADPLVHLMRNAIDHGLEPSEERVRRGKPAKGTIRLDARHHGGEVWISVSEDGRGLDRDRILSKAIDRGLVDPGGTASWPDSAVYQLIFEPGFSTAATVTNVSGRGVGLDVVRRNIQQLKGRIEIASERGQGTTFTLRIPLTLAIIEGMLVEVGEAQYTIPLLSIRESIQIGRDTIRALPDGRELADVRGTFVPVIRLASVHGLTANDPARGILVIVEHEAKLAALHVDAMLGQRQTVIKPLPDYLGDHATIAGCSILSSGQISLILNLGGLTAHIKAVRGAGPHEAAA